jgi:hypothetical protein
MGTISNSPSNPIQRVQHSPYFRFFILYEIEIEETDWGTLLILEKQTAFRMRHSQSLTRSVGSLTGMQRADN